MKLAASSIHCYTSAGAARYVAPMAPGAGAQVAEAGDPVEPEVEGQGAEVQKVPCLLS